MRIGIQDESGIIGAGSQFPVVGSCRKWVFPADEVCGLCDYEAAAIQPVPVTVARAMQTYTSGIITVNSRQAGIINEELFFGAFDRSLT